MTFFPAEGAGSSIGGKLVGEQLAVRNGRSWLLLPAIEEHSLTTDTQVLGEFVYWLVRGAFDFQGLRGSEGF